MISGVSGYIGTEASLSPTGNSRQGGIMQTSQLTLFQPLSHMYSHSNKASHTFESKNY